MDHIIHARVNKQMWSMTLLLGLHTVFSGCAATDDQLRTGLVSNDPRERIRSTISIARQHRSGLLPELVDRLEDDDPAVRFHAMMALQTLTGTRRGYSYSAPLSKRREGVADWRRYLQETSPQASMK